MELGIQGKRAWVTGGSEGLGLAIAQSLYREGADVILSSRSEAKLTAARARLTSEKGGKGDIVLLPLDMMDEASLKSAVAKAGAVDILIINTGGPAAGQAMDISLAQWDEGYRNLLRSTIQLTQAVVPGMKARRWGRILTITSTSAKELIPRLPVSGVFRAGLSSWTKATAKELGRDGILVNNLLPGPTSTARLAHLASESPDFFKSMEERSALGRLGRPEEIGDLAAFLCSARNGFVTGTDILADGGATNSF